MTLYYTITWSQIEILGCTLIKFVFLEEKAGGKIGRHFFHVFGGFFSWDLLTESLTWETCSSFFKCRIILSFFSFKYRIYTAKDKNIIFFFVRTAVKISENDQQKCKGLYVTKRSRPPCQCYRAYLFRSERLPKAPNYYVSNYQKFRVLLCI